MAEVQEKVAGIVEQDDPNIPGDQAEGAESDTTLKPDYKAELEKAIARIGQLEQRAKSAEGRLRSGGDSEILTGLKNEVNRLSRQMRRSDVMQEDLEPAERTRKLEAIQEESQQKAEVNRVVKYAQRLSARSHSTSVHFSGDGFQPGGGGIRALRSRRHRRARAAPRNRHPERARPRRRKTTACRTSPKPSTPEAGLWPAKALVHRSSGTCGCALRAKTH